MGAPFTRKLRFLALIFSVLSLALTVLTFFLPLFENRGERHGTITLWRYKVKGETSTDANNNGTSGGHHDAAAGGAEMDGEILYEDYFTCDYGRLHIQIVEGLNIVAATLNIVNFIMCGFFFGEHGFLRMPLATYFLLAATCSGVALGLLLDWYKSDWCESQPCLSCVKGDHWQYSFGWIFLAASSGSSLAGAVAAIVPA